MLKRIYNACSYFLVPFLIWSAIGGILLVVASKQALFAVINTHHNTLLDPVMYYITWLGQGEIIIAVLLLLFAVPRFRNWWYFISALVCNITPFLIAQAIKGWLDWPRPINFFEHAAWIHLDPQWPMLLYQSFPSGHSEGAFSFLCFLTLLLPPRYKKFGLLFFLLALSVAYSRVYLAAHFFSDVYAGSLLGTVSTIITFAILEKYKHIFVKQKNAAI